MPAYGYLLPTRGIVQSSGDDATIAERTRTDIVEQSRLAESLGFTGIWAGDSVLAKPRHEPLTTLAAVAAATETVDLGTAVYLPALRNPVHVAHQTVTLDQLSGGRFRFGIGVGIGPDVEAEYANLGVPFRERGPRTDELLDVVTRLWTGDPVDHDGRFYRLDDASLGFGPARTPPIYIPTAAFDPTEGFPDPIANRLVTHGDGWLPTAVTPGTYRDSLDGIRGLLADAGRDPDDFDRAAYVNVVIDENETRALDDARAFFDRYYPARDTMSDDAIRATGAVGTPAQVAARLDEYADAGVERMVVRFTTTDQRTQLRRFADVVDI